MVLLLVTVIVLVNTTPVQNYLARKAATLLSEKLKTKVAVAHVRIDFLNHFLIQGVYIESQNHDTLLYAGEAQIRITDWFIFVHKPVIHYLGLSNTYVHLSRQAHTNVWNYDFIADAFGSDNKSQGGKQIEFDLKKVDLENIRFYMDDKWGGEDIHIDAGNLVLNADDIDFKNKLINLENINIKNSDVSLNEYKAGHPPRPHNDTLQPAIDTTPFNTGKWIVKLKTLNLDGCSFHLTANDKIPVPDLFDENHLAITRVKASINTVKIIGDTISGNVTGLFAHERCGLEIRQMKSKVSVSPVASVCSDLYLETSNSKVRDYYAMHYKHFPDFLEYIDKVVMVGRMTDATADIKDIAYFASQLKKFPPITFRIKGEGSGTVANLSAHNLIVSDGNSVFNGNISMKGLPDIYKTYITWTDGKLVTNGQGILRYTPMLRNSPDVALEDLTYAVFSGNYTGYIENFAVKGVVNTNLGILTANVKLNMPGFNIHTAQFSGNVTSTDLQIGTLLKQPLLGGVTLNEDISGTSFDPGEGLLKLNGMISELTLNKYTYHKITTNGVLAKKQFNGNIQVDDSNLALEFDGDINFTNKNIVLKASAHLLGSNFKALNLTQDLITATADFDLNCTGSNIDNFSGTALLNNISIKRNSQRLALDSVLVNATGDSLNKLLTIQSNAVLASIQGNYRLSKLANSVQYYLSRYLPNYIKEPEKYAPEQNFTFKVKTYLIDSILAVAFPLMRGFDSSVVSGSLNTTDKKLLLTAAIPYGIIGGVHMNNISIEGAGDLVSLGLSTNIQNISVADSMIYGSLSLTTSVGNDSVNFIIGTSSPDSSSSLTLNGRIFAFKDSLFLTMMPSQFWLNKAKWDIPGGKIAYSDKYLKIDGLTLTSGLQKITASTQFENNDRNIIINTENLDLGQLGAWAGLSVYQPDGLLSGTISVDKVFNNPHINTHLLATGVLLGIDTVGTINVTGDYDIKKKIITFDPQSGIYRDNSSIIASGTISFDSSSQQKLDGKIEFKKALVAWADPFLTGIMSHLTGTVDGTVSFKGTSIEPVMDGNVTLQNGGFKVDYMGCSYTVPSANVHIDNRVISFGKVTAYDAYKNTAYLTGKFTHNLFRKMKMALKVTTDKFEVLNLGVNDNNLFYGNITGGMDSFTITGPFDNIMLNAYNAVPAAKSRLYIPESTSAGTAASYTFATFKVYGHLQDQQLKRSRSKITISIDANINPLLETHIILDPSSGDEIMAKGYGQISLFIPPNNDISMNGTYTIEHGQYLYTFKSLRLQRVFSLSPGGFITFNGPFSQTAVSVDAVYSLKARLYDMLSDADKTLLNGNSSDKADALTPQIVDVIMHMNGLLNSQKLTFDLDLEDKHTQGTVVYQMLRLVNNDDRQKFNQVASLLIIGDFTSPEGIGGSTAITGAINNVSQILSSSTSIALTKALNKITGDKRSNIDVKYTNYNVSDPSVAAINRNEFKLGYNHSFLNNRLQVEVGGTSDWGHPTSQSAATNFDITGDFRIQYQVTEQSNVRANVFRTSDYDVTIDRTIIRSGVGLTWRKSFDRLGDFFRGYNYTRLQKLEELKNIKPEPSGDTVFNPKPAGSE